MPIFDKSRDRVPLNAVTIISRYDSAIDLDKSDLDAYLEDPIKNADKLVFKPNEVPTKFICNFEHTGRQGATIKNSMIGGHDEDNNPKLALGSLQYAVTKISLKEIDNPPNVSGVIMMKKDSHGYVHDEVMNALERNGIISEIFGHYSKLTERVTEGQEKNS